jgi:hypothetical protein
MSDGAPSNRPLGERVRDLRLVERTLQRAVREALRRHKQAGNPIAVWHEGHVVWLTPDEIPLPAEE